MALPPITASYRFYPKIGIVAKGLEVQLLCFLLYEAYRTHRVVDRVSDPFRPMGQSKPTTT